MWSTRHFFNLQSDGIAYTNNYGKNGHILQYKMFGEYCHWTFCTVFKDKLIFFRYMEQSLPLVFGTVFMGWNQLQIFDNDNFSIIPKSIFSDNDNLPISWKMLIYRLSIIFSILSPTPTWHIIWHTSKGSCKKLRKYFFGPRETLPRVIL